MGKERQDAALALLIFAKCTSGSKQIGVEKRLNGKYSPSKVNRISMKKVLLLVVSLPILFSVLIACSEAKVDVKKLDGKWTVVEVDGTPIENEKMPFIEFNMTDLTVHGNAGCNTFRSSIKPDAKNISSFTLTPAAATMMACLNMETEGKIFKTFDAIKSVKADKDKNRLLLVDAEGKTLLVLAKQ